MVENCRNYNLAWAYAGGASEAETPPKFLMNLDVGKIKRQVRE